MLTLPSGRFQPMGDVHGQPMLSKGLLLGALRLAYHLQVLNPDKLAPYDVTGCDDIISCWPPSLTSCSQCYKDQCYPAPPSGHPPPLPSGGLLHISITLNGWQFTAIVDFGDEISMYPSMSPNKPISFLPTTILTNEALKKIKNLVLKFIWKLGCYQQLNLALDKSMIIVSVIGFGVAFIQVCHS